MDYVEIEKITERVKQENGVIPGIKEEMAKVIFGQEDLIEKIIITFLCGGHILVEGLPGLAKTLTIRAFAKTINVNFQRIQFTPDLLPADLTGTQIYNPKDMNFFTKKGPLFTNLLLADEINRAPAKVQSALLQAMEEKNITIGDNTYELDKPFMVLATENPIEQEGTYPLPEAQLDRFFMKCLVEYPTIEEEKSILTSFHQIDPEKLNTVVDIKELLKKREIIESIYIDEKLIDYIVAIINETRNPVNKEFKRIIDFGASPRASIALMKASRTTAFIKGRGFVTPDDIKEVATHVLRHRIILSYEAEAENISADDAIKRIIDTIEVP